MFLAVLIMLLIIVLGIGWGVYTNVSLYKHGAIKTRRFARAHDLQMLSRASSVAPEDLYWSQVDAVYDNGRSYMRRAATFVFFTVVFIFFFLALVLNAFAH